MTGLWWVVSFWRADDGFTVIVSNREGPQRYVQKKCVDPRVRPVFEAYLAAHGGVGGGSDVPLMIEEAGVDTIRRAYVPQDIEYQARGVVLAHMVLKS